MTWHDLNEGKIRMTMQAALWDVDGTLVDTGELHYQAWCALAREANLPFTHDDFAATFGWRNPEIIPKLWDIHDPHEVKRIGDRKEDLYRNEVAKGVALLPGVRRMLDALRAAGLPQAIGTSAPRRNLELVLELTGTTDIFAALVSMEDTQRGKPDPEVFLRGAEKLCVVPTRCVVFEDAPVGVRAAKSAGMVCVAVTFVGHHSVQSLQEAGADLVVPSLEEVELRDVRGLFSK